MRVKALLLPPNNKKNSNAHLSDIHVGVRVDSIGFGEHSGTAPHCTHDKKIHSTTCFTSLLIHTYNKMILIHEYSNMYGVALGFGGYLVINK